MDENQNDIGEEDPGDVEADEERGQASGPAVLHHVAQLVPHRHLPHMVGGAARVTIKLA